MIKKILGYCAVALLVCGLIFMFIRSVSYNKRALEWKGRYDMLLSISKEHAKQLQGNIERAINKINDLSKANKELSRDVSKKNETLAEKDEKIEALEKEYASILTDKDKVVNLTAQVNKWKEKFAIAESILADKDKIIFNLTDQYKAQVAISLNYKSALADQIELNKVLTIRLNIYEKKISLSKFGSTIKTIVIGALGGFIIYSAVK